MTKAVLEKNEKRTVLIHKAIHKKPVNTDSIEAMTQETDKKVHGQFINVECPGQPAKICGKYYKGMEYFSEVLEDGRSYTVPWSVARFINERCFTTEHTSLLDDKGNPIKGNKQRPRYKFIIESMSA